MSNALEIRKLVKNYDGLRALDGADMTVATGSIVGLLGPNASGKTTLLKTVAGLLQPTAGEIRYPDGAPMGPEARGTIGFCPDDMKFPRWMKVKDAFTFYGDMYEDFSRQRADELTRILDLSGFIETHIYKLSKGIRERLILGLTFSRVTRLYLLDEPLDGIDPVGKTKVIDAILNYKADDASVLISTHLVKDIEHILDSVSFLSKGKVVYSGECDAIREEKSQTVEQAYLEVFINETSV